MSTTVYLETGAKRVFACAVEWPGWVRSGKTAQQALETLAAYASRYAEVAARAGYPFDAARQLEVVETVAGDTTTDFGAPGKTPELDRRAPTPDEAEQLARFYEAAWAVLDDAAAGAPAELRKGPRGGGRDRDAVLEHVIEAERSYATKLGMRLKTPALGDHEAVSAFRQALAATIRTGAPDTPERGWPLRYGVRRIVWHLLDHAWEIEDRAP